MKTSGVTREALLTGGVVRGEFAPLGVDEATPGTLTWSFEDGAELLLIGPTPSWRRELGRFDQVIHGVLEGRDEITLLSAGVTRIGGFGGPVQRVSSNRLVLGEHIDTTTRWPRAIYGTTNLSEWMQETGLQSHRPEKPGDPSGVLWSPPPRHEFELPRGSAALAGEAELGPIGLVNSWTVSTRSVLVVNLRRPSTLDDLYDRYGVPLVSFTAFAADRPDSINFEVMFDPETSRRVEVWRRGLRFEPRSWNPAHGFVFRAHDLPRLSTALRRWWKLHALAWPALGLFAEHVTNGNSYSPARFLTLYAAMEAYCRTRFGRKDLKLMRHYAGVGDNVHGCGGPGLALIGQSRDYFSHYNMPDSDEAARIRDKAFETTRCAHALMQACLLREMGFGHRRTATLLHKHYSNWPIPDLGEGLNDT
jgi:hypothetical protein